MSMIPYFSDFISPFERLFPDFDSKNIMPTDVIEGENGMTIKMDLPGIEKNDINIELDDGRLTVSASNNSSIEETRNNGKYIRKERHAGSYTRSFLVSKNLTVDDIKAVFKNGTLSLDLPKRDQIEEKRTTVCIEE